MVINTISKNHGGIGLFFTLILLSSLIASGWFYLEYLDDEMQSDLSQTAINELNQTSSLSRNKIELLQLQNNKLSDQLNELNNIKDLQQSTLTELAELRGKLEDAELKLASNQSELDQSLAELNQTRHKSVLSAEEIIHRELEIAKLKQELSNTDIRISNLRSRFTVFEMQQEILFNRGDATLKPDGKKALASLARIFKQFPDRQIAIQGHSDNEKLSPATQQKYATNWELSAARSASAIHFLQGIEGIKPERMILVSYAQYQPMNSNDTVEGRARNRRIEIILMPGDFDFFRETTSEL
jgi:chemotaxis protein MotB